MDLAPEKIGYIIQMVRQHDNGETYEYEDSDDRSIDSVDFDHIDEELAVSRADQIADYIDGLNEDESLDLVALMWVGRGTYSPDQFEQAREVAEEEATHTASEYLLGTPLLADYLEDGLEAMGISVEDAEEA